MTPTDIPTVAREGLALLAQLDDDPSDDLTHQISCFCLDNFETLAKRVIELEAENAACCETLTIAMTANKNLLAERELLVAVAEASDAEVKRLREALEQTDNSRLSAYELAEGTFYEMEALKMGVRKFFDVIKTNIVNSPAFPEDMRFMAKMLLVNNEALLREAESGTLQLSQNPDRLALRSPDEQ